MTKAVTVKECQQLQQEYTEHLEKEREALKARIDNIDDEYRLYILKRFLDGLLKTKKGCK